MRQKMININPIYMTHKYQLLITVDENYSAKGFAFIVNAFKYES